MANFKSRSIWAGDNLHVMRGLDSDSVDMIYLDPPFNSDEDYGDPLSGDGDFKDKWTWKDVDAEEHGELAELHPAVYEAIGAARSHSRGMTAYLIYMASRLIEMQRILKPTGQIFLHCDDAAGHYLKILMDAVFGRRNFRAHVAWKRTTAKNNATRKIGRLHDFILHYAGEGAVYNPQYGPHDESYIARFDQNDGDGKGPYMLVAVCAPDKSGDGPKEWRGWEWKASRRINPAKLDELFDQGRLHLPTDDAGNPDFGKAIRQKHYLNETQGKPVGNIWTDIPCVNSQAKESVDYPTQKPEALMERIIAMSTEEGDIVFDPFCGCATTLVVADMMGRGWIGCDISNVAVDKLLQRLAGEAGDPDHGMVPLDLDTPHIFDVRVKDGRGRKMKRRDPLPARSDGAKPARKTDKQKMYGDQNGHCFGCWEHIKIQFMDIDHKNPKVQGGQDVAGNRHLMCAPCNRRKRGRTMAQWRADWRREDPEGFARAEDRRKDYESEYG